MGKELRTYTIRSLIDPNRRIVAYNNTQHVNLTLFHESQIAKSVYITLNRNEVRELREMLQMYEKEIEGSALPSQSMTDNEIIDKVRRRLTL